MFDTLMYAKRLEAAGMTREQAEAQVTVIAEMVVDGVATKQDIIELRSATQHDIAELRSANQHDIAELKAMTQHDIAGVRLDFAQLREQFADLRGEFNGLRGEFTGLRGEFTGLRGEIKNDLMALEHKMTLKLGAMFVVATGLLATVMTILK